jgi:DNA invertase Pin-like site-specific DNA recombinase
MHPQCSIPADVRAALTLSLPPVPCKRLAPPTYGAFLYARRSKPKQANIERQWRLEEKYARQLDVPVMDRSKDEKSGLRRDREGLEKMLEAARARRFSHLILYMYDRLSREDRDFLTIVYELFDLGIQVYCTYEGEITRANAADLAAKSKRRVVEDSRRFIATLADLAEGGMKLGAPLIGYMKGDEPGHYVEDTAGKKYRQPSGPVVRELFRRYAADEPIYQLRNWFNAELGTKKTHNDIRRLLKNPYYRGVNVNCRMQASEVFGYRPRDESEWKWSYHKAPLCDEETWVKVEARLQRDDRVGQHREAGTKHVLSGLVHCTRCARRLTFHTKGHGSVEGRCQVCNASRTEGKLLAILEHDFCRILFTFDVVQDMVAERVAEQRQAAERDLAAAQAKIARVTKLRKGYQDMRALGELSGPEYMARMQESDREWEKLQAERDAVQRRLEERGDSPAELVMLQAMVHGLKVRAGQRDYLRGDDARALYLRCIKAIHFDPDAALVTVEWGTPAVLFVGAPITRWHCPAGRNAVPTPHDEDDHGVAHLVVKGGIAGGS